MDSQSLNTPYIVYRHIFPNNKSYIGITRQPPLMRWKNGSGYYAQPKMRNAIRKYKWKNVKHEVLADGLSFIEAAKLEKHYINLYDSFVNGYNSSEGGEGGSLGAKHTFESKQKISAKMKGNKNGNPNCFKEYQQRNGAWNSKEVEVFSLATRKCIGRYRSIREAAIALSVNHSYVCKHLRLNEHCTLYGYDWRLCNA